MNNYIKPVVLLGLGVCCTLLMSACGGSGANSGATNASNAVPSINKQTPPGSATATLSLSTATPTPGSNVVATINLSNATTSAISGAGLTLNLPVGFAASDLTQGSTSCGGTTTLTTNKLTLSSASVAANGSCSLSFTVTTPVLALPGTYSPTLAFSGLTKVVAGNAPAFSMAANIPLAAPAAGAIGSTPGELTWLNLPPASTNAAFSETDFYLTPTADPGPNSDVYWSNELNIPNGYTGMQTTFLTSTQTGKTGKLFLFSIWGAINYQTGTAPESWCQFGTDGASGWSCRYVYNWQVNHTYRFRLSALGSGWFKVNVTDMSGTDSFDIGSLQLDTTQITNAVSSIPNVGGISQWIENFDWNNPRSACLDVPYSNITESMTATDASTGALILPGLQQIPNPSIANGCSNQAGSINGQNASLIGGVGQTARGLFKNTAANCINAEGGLSDGSNAILYSCPTAATSAADINSNSPIDGSLWVHATDGSIRAKGSYCLTVNNDIGASGAAVSVESCIAGAVNQEWTISNQTIVSNLSGTCLDPAGTSKTPSGNQALTLATCSNSTKWTVPGTSFSY